MHARERTRRAATAARGLVRHQQLRLRPTNALAYLYLSYLYLSYLYHSELY